MMLLCGLYAALSIGVAAAGTLPQLTRSEKPLRQRDNGVCTGGPWIDPTYVGGYADGDAELCETGFPTYAHPINVVTIYAGPEAIRGLQFGYDDPNAPATQLYGTSEGDGITAQSITINYAGGELITTAALFAQDGAMYLRGLTIETNMGQTVHGGVSQDDGNDVPYQLQDVGTGILIGASGDYQPGIIDNLGLLFLDSPVASIVVSNLMFPGGPSGTQDITPTSLAAQHFYNGDPTNDDAWSFSGSKAVTSTSTYSQTTTTTFGANTAIEVSGSLFSIKASDTTMFSWTSQDATMNGVTSTEVDTLTWMQSGTLNPGEGITCDSLAGLGSGTFPYTSTVTVTLQDGTVWAQYSESGSLVLNVVSSTSVSCSADNSPN